jgi:hypothetical protein
MNSKHLTDLWVQNPQGPIRNPHLIPVHPHPGKNPQACPPTRSCKLAPPIEQTTQEQGRPRRSAAIKSVALVEPKVIATYIPLDAVNYDLPEPYNIDDALSCPTADKWEAAIDKELQSLVKNNVLEPANSPSGVKIIRLRIILTIKDVDTLTPRCNCLLVKAFRYSIGVLGKSSLCPVAWDTISVR